VALRKTLNLYGAVRPIRSLAGVPTRYEDVDLVIIRENTEGLYAGIENTITEGVITSLKVATEEACRRIARFAFDYARTRGRRKVTVFHKANIMKLSDGLFLKCAREEHETHGEGIEYEELIIDAACMRIVQNPAQFDVILCENLYGDVISDLCAGLVGGPPPPPPPPPPWRQRRERTSATTPLFSRPCTARPPTIAGQNVANPLALIMSAVMMLRHLAATRKDTSCTEAADRIRDAYNACLSGGQKTRDLGGDLSTSDFAHALCERLS